jgi:hypothetical protein
MAITSDQVQDAVAKFLPRNLDIARDADSGSLDTERVAERALLIARIALLFDTEAPLHSLSLAVTAWGEELQSILDDFDDLASNDLLLSIQDQAPHYIDDLTKLRSARTRLAQLGGVVQSQGVLSDTFFTKYVEDIEGFVDDHIKENVQFRNRVVIRDEAKEIYDEISALWASLLDKKDSLTQNVADYVSYDLRSLVVSEVITSIYMEIDNYIEMLEGSDSSEHASIAEQMLVDLAASKAVISIIKNAPSPEGTTIVGPASDGSTPNDYLQRTGIGHPAPVSSVELPSSSPGSEVYVSKNGRPRLTGKIISGGYGVAVDDGDGDAFTPDFLDAAADFVSDGVQQDFYLFLAFTGMSYRIKTVGVTTLELYQEIPIKIAPALPNAAKRYLVTEEIIGTYFEDLTESFLTEYSDGETGSNVVCSGTAGQYKEDVRLSGTNGSNAKSYSTAGDGESVPRKAEGSDGQPHGDYALSGTGSILMQREGQSDGVATSGAFETLSSALAAFQTNNVQAGDWVYIDPVGPMSGETYQVLSVLSENTLRISGTWSSPGSGITYRVISSSILYDSTAPFTASMIGKYLVFQNKEPASTVWYALAEITEFISASYIRIGENVLCTGNYASTSPTTGCSYSVVETYTGEYDVFYSPTLDAFNNLIRAGDELTISGYTATADTEDLNDTWEITEVLDANRVRIDIDPPFGDPTTAMTNQTGLTWHITRGDVDVTKLFYAPDGQFITGQVEGGDKLYIDDGTGADVGSSFTVDTVESETVLLLTTALSGNQTDLEWHVSPSTTDFFRDPDVIMYTGGLSDGNEFELTINTSSPVGQAGDYGLDEDDVGVYTLETTDALANSDLYLYTDWEVVPADGKTWLFYQTDLDFSDYDGGGSEIGPLVTLDGVLGQAYLVVAGTPTAIYFRILDDPYDLASSSSTLRLADRITADAGPLSWEIWRGLTTSTFKDTTNSPFGDSEVGDVIRLDPGGPSEQDVIITEVVSASEVTVTPELDPGQTGLTYALFNSVKPGMELVTSGVRVIIDDIDSEHVLKLRSPIPATSGKNLRWFVVRYGTDLQSNYLVDDDPTFIAAPNNGFGTVAGGAHDWVEGSTIHVMGPRPIIARIVGFSDLDGDGVYEAVLLDRDLDIAAGGVAYKVLDLEEKKTFTFTTSESLAGVAAGDLLTVWGSTDVFNIESVDGSNLTVNPRINAGLTSQDFVIVRGGTQSWGRYLLLEHLLGSLTAAANLDTFELRLAEVVADFGGTRIGPYILSGANGSLLDDGDDDSITDLLVLPPTPAIAAGDKVVMIVDSVEVFTYVAAVAHSVTETIVTMYREYSSSASISAGSVYVFQNSVTFVLSEIAARRAEVVAFKEVADAFVVPESASIGAAASVLDQSGLDAAKAAILGGDIESMLEMSATEASSTDASLSAVNTVGRTTTADTSNIDGSDSTEDSSPASSSVTVAEEVETRIALAELSAWLVSRKKLETISRTSLAEMRDRRIFEITGEIESTLVSDEDDTLPWLASTGSEKARILAIKEAALAALDYMIDNPDQFEDVEIE